MRTPTTTELPTSPRGAADDHAGDGGEREFDRSALGRRARRPSGRPRAGERHLGAYLHHGREREIVLVRTAGANVVLDRESHRAQGQMLVGRLGPEEPAANAELLARLYLADHERRGRCRSVDPGDLADAHSVDDRGCTGPSAGEPAASVPARVDAAGFAYSLLALDTGMSIPELRWRRTRPGGDDTGATVSLREAIGALESYEPMCALSRLALGRTDASTTVLRVELARVDASPIVLNRALREAVLAAVARGEASMSEIAMRCGRIKRDRRGNESGETSWLARRIGLLPEGGHHSPTPWIHSDVLALIARCGLGVSPREVEL